MKLLDVLFEDVSKSKSDIVDIIKANCSQTLKFYDSVNWSDEKLLKRFSSSQKDYIFYDGNRERKGRLGNERMGVLFDKKIRPRIDEALPKRHESYFFGQFVSDNMPSMMFGSNCYIMFPYDDENMGTSDVDFNDIADDRALKDTTSAVESLSLAWSGYSLYSAISYYSFIADLTEYTADFIKYHAGSDEAFSQIHRDLENIASTYMKDSLWDINRAFKALIFAIGMLKDRGYAIDVLGRGSKFGYIFNKHRAEFEKMDIFAAISDLYKKRIKLITPNNLSSGVKYGELWMSGKSIAVNKDILKELETQLRGNS